MQTCRKVDGSEQYISAVSEIIARNTSVFVTPASFEQDCFNGTDYVVTAAHQCWAVRIRSSRYMRRYPWEFTVRSRVRGGGETELHKIRKGWGDRMLYAYAGEAPGELDAWRVLDLHAFRQQEKQDRALYPLVGDNHDGTGFLAFDVRRFLPDPRLVLETRNLPEIDARQVDMFAGVSV